MSTGPTEKTFAENMNKIKSGFALEVLQHIGEGLAIADENEILVYVNPTLCSMTGYTMKEFIGRVSRDFIHEDHVKVAQRALQERIDHGKSIYEVPLKKKSGGYLDVQITSVSLWEKEKFTGSIALIRDLTETRKKENDLREALNKAEVARQEKEKFVASMSHEIRTPMGGILGMAQLLRQTELSEEQIDYLDAIVQSAKSLTHILDDILEFSELDSGQVKLDKESFSIRKSVRQIFRTFEMGKEKENLEFALKLEESVPDRVLGDHDRYLQILTQLLGNAFKFTSDGSISLNISAEPIESGDHKVLVTSIVNDTGKGISDEIRGSEFESFSKAIRDTMTKKGGTGLGLAIVKLTVELMGGEIQLESRDEKGTSVIVKLPFELDQEKPREKSVGIQANRDQSAALEGRTVIVADDHPVNQKVVQGILGKAGVDLLIAENGNQTLELLRQNPQTDLILMDVHMSGMGGLEATRKIRAEFEEPTKSIPIVAVTASAMASDIEKCKQAGMNDFISKPFTLQELTDRILENIRPDSGNRDGGKEDNISEDVGPVSQPDPESEFEPAGSSDKSIPAGEPDFSVLREMTSGNRKMMLQIIYLFLDQTPELTGRLVDLSEQGNWRKMAEIAHKVKPTFIYLGMDDAYELSQELEQYKEKEVSAEEERALREKAKKIRNLADTAFPDIKKAADRLNVKEG